MLTSITHPIPTHVGVQREPVVDSGWKMDQVTRLQVQADPAVVIATKLKEAAASQYQADLGILVHVFRVECPHLEIERDWVVLFFQRKIRNVTGLCGG